MLESAGRKGLRRLTELKRTGYGVNIALAATFAALVVAYEIIVAARTGLFLRELRPDEAVPA